MLRRYGEQALRDVGRMVSPVSIIPITQDISPEYQKPIV